MTARPGLPLSEHAPDGQALAACAWLDVFGDIAETGTAERLRQMAIRRSNTMPGSKSIHYSDEWYTPKEIPFALGAFDLDPCAGPMNHARENVRLPECGLRRQWKGRVWLNPPYSNVKDWLAKMVAHGDGIAFVNARPETLWFQRALETACAVMWLRGRVDFQRPDRVATHSPVGSVLVAYGDHNGDALERCSLKGVVMRIARGKTSNETEISCGGRGSASPAGKAF